VLLPLNCRQIPDVLNRQPRQVAVEHSVKLQRKALSA
jgi:hypothetical protein